jgi:chemotaxis protein methyltransferase CheR
MEEEWPIRTRFNAIFCRNVLIYFDRASQHRLLRRLMSLLTDDGLLFLGHSESLHGLFASMRHVETTIYQRVDPASIELRKGSASGPAEGVAPVV